MKHFASLVAGTPSPPPVAAASPLEEGAVFVRGAPALAGPVLGRARPLVPFAAQPEPETTHAIPLLARLS